MSTTTVALSNAASQNETILTDAEIASRVLAIRASWDVRERIQRRRVATERFEQLLDVLQNATHAA